MDHPLTLRVIERFGERCEPERACGGLLGIDCGSAADGPYYYVRIRDFKRLARCGGRCWKGPCPDCPPPGWDCKTY